MRHVREAVVGHVIAIGGGGFSEDEPLIDDYILSIAGSDRPRVGFLATASGDSAGYIERFYEAFAGRAEVSHLRLFPMPSNDISDWADELDVVYVGGGSTANLLAVWRTHVLDDVLRAAYESGAVLAGVSAGAMCWFEGGITDSFGPYRPLRDGLGLISGSFTPHYDRDHSRRAALHEALGDGFPSGFAADDGAALHFTDGELRTVVSTRPEAHGYIVTVEMAGRVTEAAQSLVLLDANDRRPG
jgi:dipeptidase E